MTGPLTAIGRGLRRFATTSGRATRSEFWWFLLAYLLLGHVVAFVVSFALSFGPGFLAGLEAQRQGRPVALDPGAMGLASRWGTLSAWLAWLVAAVPLVAVAGRRLHDTGRRAGGLWLALPAFVAAFALVSAYYLWRLGDPALAGQQVGLRLVWIVGLAVLPFAWWLSRPSQAGPNRFGPDPHARVGAP